MVASASEDFKSLMPNVKSAEDVDDELYYGLSYQWMFERKTSPFEKFWDEEDPRFDIEANDIDRLYYMRAIRTGEYNESDYCLVGRMKYKGGHVFVEMYAGCDSSGFDCQGQGYIYVTADPNIFYNVVAVQLDNSDDILQSLLDDGYKITCVEAVTDRVTAWNNPCRLLFLCHEAVKDNIDRLAHYSDVLPPPLAKTMDEFLKYREASDDYLE